MIAHTSRSFFISCIFLTALGFVLSSAPVSAQVACSPGCPTGARCNTGTGFCEEFTCNDAVDNDVDALVDCADPDCALQRCGTGIGASCNFGTGLCEETSCNDRSDNDQDGLIDCEDPDCDNLTCTDTFSCTVGNTCDAATGLCGSRNHAECDDGLFCNGNERCNPNSGSADSRGCVDRPDPCDPTLGMGCDEANDVCTEVYCEDGLDNDLDGPFDCNDSDCPCPPGTRCTPAGLCRESNCMDGLDNDGDGDIDCADANCTGEPCSDGIACTNDSLSVCGGGICPPGIPNNAACDDGLWCNGPEQCDPFHPAADPVTGCRQPVNRCTDPGEACDEANDTCVETACTDSLDNDSDADVDCVDSDCPCPVGSACNPGTQECEETSCADGRDNDNDGLVDCDDPNCNGAACSDGFSCTDDSTATCLFGSGCVGATPVHPNCDDGLFCNGPERCQPASPSADPVTGCRDSADPCDPTTGMGCDEATDTCTEAICDDGIDNDLDGPFDCNDSDCPCPPGTRCAAGVGRCVESACADGVDNDNDGQVDCEDVNCNTRPCSDGYSCTDDSTATCAFGIGCVGGTPDHGVCDNGQFCDGRERCDPANPNANPITGCRDSADPCIDPGEACDEFRDVCTEEICDDSIDNDSDGDFDCNDSDCPCPPGSVCNAATGRCVERICDDGIDNDLDGRVDCDDGSCTGRACSDGISCTDDSASTCPGAGIPCPVGTPDHTLCDNNLFCDGLERCAPGVPSADPVTGCRPGVDPCPWDGAGCDEDNDVCIETACFDGTNNDRNEGPDCRDPDCPCPEGSACNLNINECEETNCTDGVDNDLDGVVDCEDPNCNFMPCEDGFACTSGETCDGAGNCANGVEDNTVCADGVWCNGVERCRPTSPNADADGCIGGVDPCPAAGEGCDEDTQTCIEDWCDDSVDNDTDGLTDCNDRNDCPCPAGSSCDPGTARCQEFACNDGIDNDSDGWIDCLDPDCDLRPCEDGFACTTGETCNANDCTGGTENHAVCDDGLFCNGLERCRPASPNADAAGCIQNINPPCTKPGAECDEQNDVCVEVNCIDNDDNDDDLRIDCADSDCIGANDEICDDGFDNDCNGFTDCLDQVCLVDADGDGFIVEPCGGDCDDTNPNINPGRNEDCTTPWDDNCNGLINCNDPDCQVDADGDGQDALPCGEDCDDNDPNNFRRVEEICDDGQDNNCNFLVDCQDGFCDGRGCDDGWDCTINDACSFGLCRGTPDDRRCDDGLFCNGAEVCAPSNPGADTGGCIEGPEPCAPDQFCNERTQTCEDACSPDPFEPDDACTQARNIVMTQTLQNEAHTLCPEGDVDRVTFAVEAGAQYTLYTTGGLDTRGTLTTGDCQQDLAFNNDCTLTDPNFCIVWTATFTGDVVLAVDSGVSPMVPLKADMPETATAPTGGPRDGVQVFETGRPGEVGELGTMEAIAGNTGNYVLWFQRTRTPCVPDGYEPDDNCGSATTITPTSDPASQDHSICPPGDRDWFRFLGVQGTTYNFHTTGGTDTRGEIRSENCGSVLASNESCSGDHNFCLTFTPSQTGYYTVRVAGQASATTGPYTFHYQTEGGCSPDPQEPDDTCFQANFLAVGPVVQSVVGSICPEGDVDFFRFFGDSAHVYVFRTLGVTDVRLLVGSDDCGMTLADENSCGDDPLNACIFWRPPVSGNYKLRVQGRHGGVTGSYILQHSWSGCPPDDWEPDNGCKQATGLDVDFNLKRQSHTICPGEELDLFEFFAQKDAIYSFYSEGPTNTAGGVLSSTCKKILVKDESCGGAGENFCVRWTAPETGTYKFAVTGDPQGGPYDLFYQQVNDPGTGCLEDGAEPDDTCAQATVIQPTMDVKTFGATLCPPDDRDNFRFDAVAGRVYEFWTTGSTDTVGSIRNQSCGKLVSNDDCDRPDNLNFCLRWRAPEDGTYHVRVKGYSRDQTVGPYELNYRIVSQQ